VNKTIVWMAAAIVVGAAGGAALGYWEARPWTIHAAVDKPAAPKEAPAAASGEAPRAAIAETTYKFDKMETGAQGRHAFPIRNEGKSPLTVAFLSHTCKCTKVELDGKEVDAGDLITIPPGGQGEALLEWAGVAAGPFRHGASFETNDPALSRLELYVEGEIVESTTLQPSLLSFGSVQVGEPARAEAMVVAFAEPEVKVLSHEVVDAKLAERVKVAVEPVAKDELPKGAEAAARIVATFEPGSTLGPFAGAVRLKTNLERAASLVLPIHGIVKGDISIIANSGWSENQGLLRMPPIDGAEGGALQLKVAIRGDHAAETELSVKSVSPPELKASLGERIAIRDNFIHVPLTVEIPPGTRSMIRNGDEHGGEGEVVLATTHPVTPEVRLRVMFTVK
jgi:hypothetical protein